MALSFEFDFEAAKAALLYLASKELPQFDKYRAVKLLFLADRAHLLRFGRPITGDTYYALPYGPTPDRILDLLNGLQSVALEGREPLSGEVADLAGVFFLEDLDHPTYHATVEPDLDALSGSDVMVLDEIAVQQGTRDFNDLKSLTHGMKAYTNAWRDGESGRRFPMSFEDFFADEPDRSEFLREIAEEQRLAKLFPSVAGKPQVTSV